VTVEADSYYGNLNGQSQAQQNFVIGPQFTFRDDRAKLRPFLYAQGGDQRSDVSHYSFRRQNTAL
jgi:hypothetical protein